MQQSQPRALLPLWSDLCHVFRHRISFLPRPGEFRASFCNYGNDQINFHRQHIRAWDAATEMLRPLPTSTLLSLLDLARENRAMLKDTVKFNSWLFVCIMAFATFVYTVAKTVFSHLFSLAAFWDHLLSDLTYPVMIAVIIAFILLLHSLHWFSMHQSREIKSCIQVVLAERYYEEPEDRRPSVTDGSASGLSPSASPALSHSRFPTRRTATPFGCAAGPPSAVFTRDTLAPVTPSRKSHGLGHPTTD